jgi:hypothetical protein
MGESLNLRRRVSDEGRKIVKLFSGTLKLRPQYGLEYDYLWNKPQPTTCQQLR